LNNYLIPANSKKSMLILSVFTFADLMMFGIGIAVTLLLLLLFRTTSIGGMIIIVLPALITGALVMPIPNYHNVLGFLNSILYYATNRKQYIWKGWCVKDVYGRDFENRK
jgi:hypothetical protein